YVVAYKKVNGKNVKISKSENMHVVTIGGKYGNAKKVTVNKSSVSVKKVKTYQLEAKVTNTSKYAKYHARSVRFVTDNPSVAKVSKSGKIKGISKGTCYIYCFANNGIYKKVRITVK
ncbi:MAG: Ig-like domain-containing protein, partial [Blautia sp.]|nr:Ig-like domain-containing protein [Blautia sp.]